MNKSVFSWAIYDWANSAFAIVVLAGFYPIFFRDYWAVGQSSETITLYLGIANSASSLIIVLLAPILGAIGDQGGLRKKLLAVFAFLGILMTISLAWVAQGQWQMAALLFTAGSIGFMGSNVFYDSLLVDTASPDDYDRVSSLGYGLGYLGSGVLFSICVYATLNPQTFGLESAAEAVKISFLATGLWWAVFSIPLFLFVEEKKPESQKPLTQAVSTGLRQLSQTFHRIKSLREVWLFLLAYWLYIDGVDTIIRMAVDYGKALGFESNQLITALLVTQFVGFPAALFFGWLGQKTGTRQGILIGIVAYCGITLWAYQMTDAWEFYGLAIAVGLVQGGIQALSRAFYARLIPEGESAEFFGFYNMLGKFAAVIGPLMVGWISVLTGNPRIGLLSILILFIAGGWLLTKVHTTAS